MGWVYEAEEMKLGRRAYLKCFVIALSFVATTAFAQITSPKNTSGTSIQGKVIQDPGGQPIGKANLELNRENRASEYSATTDSEGKFRIDDITPGRYAVVIKRPGFVQRGGTRSISIAVLPGKPRLLPAAQTPSGIFLFSFFRSLAQRTLAAFLLI